MRELSALHLAFLWGLNFPCSECIRHTMKHLFVFCRDTSSGTWIQTERNLVSLLCGWRWRWPSYFRPRHSDRRKVILCSHGLTWGWLCENSVVHICMKSFTFYSVWFFCSGPCQMATAVALLWSSTHSLSILYSRLCKVVLAPAY